MCVTSIESFWDWSPHSAPNVLQRPSKVRHVNATCISGQMKHICRAHLVNWLLSDYPPNDAVYRYMWWKRHTDLDFPCQLPALVRPPGVNPAGHAVNLLCSSATATLKYCHSNTRERLCGDCDNNACIAHTTQSWEMSVDVICQSKTLSLPLTYIRLIVDGATCVVRHLWQCG